MNRLALPFVLALVLCAPQDGRGEEEPGLWQGSNRVALKDGLTSDSTGLWISRRDLADGLRVHAKRLIPSVQDKPKRNERRRADAWVLCFERFCTRYDEPTRGVTGSETFNIRKIARGLGFRLREVEGGWRVDASARRAAPARGRPGERVPPLRFRMLDGSTRDTYERPGQRLLMVVWSPWSTSRKHVGTWVSQAKARKLDVLAVAVDLEGEPRVRPYAPPDADGDVALDPTGQVLQGFGLATVDRWILIDELGLHRASGPLDRPGDWLWIDRHLAESKAPAPPKPERPFEGVGVEALREIVRRSPRDFRAKLALVSALPAASREEAATLLRELIAKQPRDMSLILRLAKLSMDANDRGEAVRILDAARRLNPARLPLRRQFWALAYPERFYDGEIDTAWQKTQRKAEDEEWGWVKKR